MVASCWLMTFFNSLTHFIITALFTHPPVLCQAWMGCPVAEKASCTIMLGAVSLGVRVSTTCGNFFCRFTSLQIVAIKVLRSVRLRFASMRVSTSTLGRRLLYIPRVPLLSVTRFVSSIFTTTTLSFRWWYSSNQRAHRMYVVALDLRSRVDASFRPCRDTGCKVHR